MKYLNDLNIKNKRVLLRVDYNVPIKNGIIIDDFRIRSSLPTINYCLENGASVIIMSHLSRPNGNIIPEMSLDPIAFHLEELLDREVLFSDNCISDDAISLSLQMKTGEIHLLENLRFYNAEIENDNEFSKLLSTHGDIYINDAFGTAHRTHASNVGVPTILKDKGAGFLIKKEIKYLVDEINKSIKPSVLVLGGSKISDKISLIFKMLERIDFIIIGGAMAFTFLKSIGKNIGGSFYEKSCLKIAKEILDKAKLFNTKILLPVDVVASEVIKNNSDFRVVEINDLNYNELGLDIGPQTCILFQEILNTAKLIVWNGPMGVSEIPAFSTGTQSIASTISAKTDEGSISIIGGGDTASTIKDFAVTGSFSHISTGGGSSLKLLSGDLLPAIEALY